MDQRRGLATRTRGRGAAYYRTQALILATPRQTTQILDARIGE
jgi:hypothetical protein